MIIEKNMAVTISYDIIVNGKFLKSTEDSIEFIFGNGNVPQEFENQIEGLEGGDTFEFNMCPNHFQGLSASGGSHIDINIRGLIDRVSYSSDAQHGKNLVLRIVATAQGLYVGGIKDNLQYGEGTLYYTGGNLYAGGWARGCFHGRGVLSYPKSKEKFNGTWQSGDIKGEGIFTQSNGSTIKGNWNINCGGGKLDPIAAIKSYLAAKEKVRQEEMQAKAKLAAEQKAERERQEEVKRENARRQEEKRKQENAIAREKVLASLTASPDGKISIYKCPKTNLYGFKSGDITIIEPIYDRIVSGAANGYQFHEGVCCVVYKGLFGYIDLAGRAITPCKYDEATPLIYGFASVRREKKWAYINKEGRLITSFRYDNILGNKYGFALVKNGSKYAYINSSGREITPSKYDQPRYSDGYDYNFPLIYAEGKWGYIDSSGKEIIPPKYDRLDYFHGRLARVIKNGKYGVIDVNDKVIVPIKYDKIYPFAGGAARVMLNDVYGHVKEDGKMIDVKYSFAGDFHNGYAYVERKTLFGAKKKGVIDMKGKEYWGESGEKILKVAHKGFFPFMGYDFLSK